MISKNLMLKFSNFEKDVINGSIHILDEQSEKIFCETELKKLKKMYRKVNEKFPGNLEKGDYEMYKKLFDFFEMKMNPHPTSMYLRMKSRILTKVINNLKLESGDLVLHEGELFNINIKDDEYHLIIELIDKYVVEKPYINIWGNDMSLDEIIELRHKIYDGFRFCDGQYQIEHKEIGYLFSILITYHEISKPILIKITNLYNEIEKYRYAC